MPELALVRDTLRDHWALMPLSVLLGVAVLAIQPEAAYDVINGVATTRPRTAALDPDATGYALLALVPMALWAGRSAAGVEASTVYLLSRPILRGRIPLLRLLLIAAMLVASAVAIVAAAPSFPRTSFDMPAVLTSGLVAVALLSSALAGCMLREEGQAFGVGALLAGGAAMMVTLPAAVLGVSMVRLAAAPPWALAGALAVTIVGLALPVLWVWLRVVPRTGRRPMVMAMSGFSGVALLAGAGVWFPLSAYSGQPQRGDAVALYGAMADGRILVGTGTHGLGELDAATIDGLVLRDGDTVTPLAGWTRSAALTDLGRDRELVDVELGPEGRRVASAARDGNRLVLEFFEVADGTARRLGEQALDAEVDSTQRMGVWSREADAFAQLVVERERATVQRVEVSDTGVRAGSITDLDDPSPRNARVLGWTDASTWVALGDGGLLHIDGDGRSQVVISGADGQAAALSPLADRVAVVHADGTVEVTTIDASALESTRRTIQPPAAADADPVAWRSVMHADWLDADHLALVVDAVQVRQLWVVRDGLVIETAELDTLRSPTRVEGPPRGPWLLAYGDSLVRTLSASGAQRWSATVASNGAMRPARLLRTVDGLRWIDSVGREHTRELPWRTEAL